MRSAHTCASASSSPAPKLASAAQSTDEVAIAPLAMLQYPAGALCTELWKRVGEIWRSPVASCWQSSWQLWPSPEDDANTVARLDGSRPDSAIAPKPVASAILIARDARRRSDGGS